MLVSSKVASRKDERFRTVGDASAHSDPPYTSMFAGTTVVRFPTATEIEFTRTGIAVSQFCNDNSNER